MILRLLTQTVHAAPSSSAVKLVGKIMNHLVTPALRLLFAVSFLLFIWGIVRMILDRSEGKAGDSGVSEGKRHMTYGLLGMFIMFAAIAIIAFIDGTITEVLAPK